jgi:hypothetical protein
MFIVFIRVFLVVHVQGLFFGVLGFDDSVKSNFILLILRLVWGSEVDLVEA